MLTALVAGLLLPGRTTLALVGAAAALALLARVDAVRLGLVAGGLLLAGSLVASARNQAIERPSRALADGDRIEVRAELLEHPRPTRLGSSARLKLVSGPARGARVLARAPQGFRWPRGVGIGAELVVAGSAERPRRRPHASFDFPAQLARRGVFRELYLESVRTVGVRDGPAGVVDGIRTRAERAIATDLPPRRAALARGMVLGQDEQIPKQVVTEFRRSGLAHLLAVSGQNVMLLCALALPLLAVARARSRTRVAVVLGLIALYVPLAGAGPSLQRAGVMGAAGVIAVAAARPASRSYALLLAAAVTLALNPRAGGEPGWQLSFAAVAGLVWLAPVLRRPMRAWPRPVAEGMALTLAATLATAPLLAHHFGSVSLVALPANLAALPVVAPVMWIGMVQCALGQLAPLGGPAAALGSAATSFLATVCEPLLGYLAAVARRCSELPAAAASLPRLPAAAVAAAYGALVAAVLVARAAARRLEPRASSAAAAWRRLPIRTRGPAVAGIAAAAALAAWWIATPARPPDSVTVSFLDVGQGDATLIQDGRGSAILFDGGPPEADLPRLLRRAGVRRLAAVVATHASRDHHGGLASVIERFPTELLLDGGDGSPDPDFRAVVAAARRRGARHVKAIAPLSLSVGDLAIEVLSPPPRPPGPAPEDPNPRAVAAIVRAGAFELMLSADAESEALAPLRLPDVDAIKVPHHGSSDPGLPALLERLRPQVAAIEVGADNGYGHPTASTLAALRGARARTYRTDRDGTVELSLEKGGIEVRTER